MLGFITVTAIGHDGAVVALHIVSLTSAEDGTQRRRWRRVPRIVAYLVQSLSASEYVADVVVDQVWA